MQAKAESATGHRFYRSFGAFRSLGAGGACRLRFGHLITAFTLAALMIPLATPVWALNQAKTPAGANYAGIAQTADDYPVGVIEIGGGSLPTSGIDLTNFHFSGRLIRDRYFIGSSPPMAADPALATGTNAHGTLVADVIASNNAANTGVATAADIYAAWIGGMGAANAAQDPLLAAVDWYDRTYNVLLFNHSWQLNQNAAAANVFSHAQRFLDWHIAQKDALHVVAAGNSGTNGLPDAGSISPPGGLYNGVSVGALDNAMTRRANYSDYISFGNSSPGKPDIVAPGTNINSGTLVNSGTSFASPMVTGALAVLADAGLGPGGLANRNHMAAKAVLLNSARKRRITGENKVNANIRDNAGSVGGAGNPDGDYLGADGFVLPTSSSALAPAKADWSPEAWTSDANKKLTTTLPLDDELGTGALDVKRMLVQFNAGEQEEKADNPGGVDLLGWNRDTVQPNASDIFEFNVGLRRRDFLTLTLAWDRPVTETDAGVLGSALGQVDSGDTYAYGAIPNLDLAIFFKNEQYAISKSTTTNLEHLHYPIPFNSNPMDWSFRVLNQGGGAIDYGIAWWVSSIPEPATIALLAIGGVILLLRRRR